MPTYGPQDLGTTGEPLAVSADGRPEWKSIGITIDWATVTAVGSDTTLADGTLVRTGEKALEFGTVLVKIDATGKYGPYLSSASDGRQTLGRGRTYILNETVVQGSSRRVAAATDNPAVLEGGLVWKARLKVGGTGQPTLSALEAVLPRLRYAD